MHDEVRSIVRRRMMHHQKEAVRRAALTVHEVKSARSGGALLSWKGRAITSLTLALAARRR
eukprot:2363516-Prymnesium_polylepis.1